MMDVVAVGAACMLACLLATDEWILICVCTHFSFCRTGKIWAKSWLALTNSVPTYSGEMDALRQGQGPCLYVANHASWLDIPILCTVLDPVFKFIAKGELKNVPCIGQQLTGVS